MSIQPTKLFDVTTLGTVASTIYSVPTSVANQVLMAGRIRVTNIGAAQHAVTAYAVPNAGTAAAGNAFLNAEAIAVNAHADFDIPNLGAGGSLQMLADAAASLNVSCLNGVLVA